MKQNKQGDLVLSFSKGLDLQKERNKSLGYAYFNGVTRLLIPDNLKTGVTQNTRYETVLNRSYHELAEHYGTAIVPARVEHPKDKSHAEGAVKFASTWIIASLRNEHFFALKTSGLLLRKSWMN